MPAFGQMAADIEALPNNLDELYQEIWLPALSRAYDGPTICGALPRDLLKMRGRGTMVEDEEGLLGRLLRVLLDAGKEGVYLADLPVYSVYRIIFLVTKDANCWTWTFFSLFVYSFALSLHRLEVND